MLNPYPQMPNMTPVTDRDSFSVSPTARPTTMNTTIAPPLFVIAAHVPTNRTCSQLAHTVGSVFRFHPEAHVLVVDNESPPGNLRASLAFFLVAERFAERVPLTQQRIMQSYSRSSSGSNATSAIATMPAIR